MGDIIRIDNSSYSRYEELLSKRDELRKKSYDYYAEYVRTFGEQILAVFQQKIECIKKKKTIEFYQQALNKGNEIDHEALQKYLSESLAEFHKQLDEMIRDTEATRAIGVVSEIDMLKIKSTYRKLAKLIHPDINPEIAQNETLMDLWNRAVIAYQCNNLKDIEEVEVLVHRVLDQMGVKEIEINIPDINLKIEEVEQEIRDIKSKNPYLYKFLLEDKEAISEKKESLNHELEEYQDYSKQLDDVIEEMISGGVKIIWKMD